MRSFRMACAFAVVLAAAPWARSQATPAPAWYLKQEPIATQFPHDGVVHVDDGTCPTGEIKEVRAVNQNRGRERRCIAWPPGLTRLLAWPPLWYLKQDAPSGQLQAGVPSFYYVEDGKCSDGEITEVTTGIGVQRVRRCITRPASGLTAALKFLSKDEVGPTLAGKVMLFALRSDGRNLRWDLRKNGTAYGNWLGMRYEGGRMTGLAGAWEVKEDGAMCIKWNEGQTDCNYFYWEGDRLRFAAFPNAESAAIGAVSVEFEK